MRGKVEKEDFRGKKLPVSRHTLILYNMLPVTVMTLKAEPLAL